VQCERHVSVGKTPLTAHTPPPPIKTAKSCAPVYNKEKQASSELYARVGLDGACPMVASSKSAPRAHNSPSIVVVLISVVAGVLLANVVPALNWSGAVVAQAPVAAAVVAAVAAVDSSVGTEAAPAPSTAGRQKQAVAPTINKGAAARILQRAKDGPRHPREKLQLYEDALKGFNGFVELKSNTTGLLTGPDVSDDELHVEVADLFEHYGDALAAMKLYSVALIMHRRAVVVRGKLNDPHMMVGLAAVVNDLYLDFRIGEALAVVTQLKRSAQGSKASAHTLPIILRLESTVHECAGDYVSALQAFEASKPEPGSGSGSDSAGLLRKHVDLLGLVTRTEPPPPPQVAQMMQKRIDQLVGVLLRSGMWQHPQQLPQKYVSTRTTISKTCLLLNRCLMRRWLCSSSSTYLVPNLSSRV
jgi:hypothetical protein